MYKILSQNLKWGGKKNKCFDGIINYLTNKYHGNVH